MLNKKSRPQKNYTLGVPFKIAQLVGRRYASFKDSQGKDREWWQNTMCTWNKGFFMFLFCKNNIKFKNIAKVVEKKRPRAQSGR